MFPKYYRASQSYLSHSVQSDRAVVDGARLFFVLGAGCDSLCFFARQGAGRDCLLSGEAGGLQPEGSIFENHQRRIAFLEHIREVDALRTNYEQYNVRAGEQQLKFLPQVSNARGAAPQGKCDNLQ